MPKLPPLVLAGCVVLLGACSSPEQASSIPGTTPAVWTGSPSPAGDKASEPGAETAPGMTAHLKAPDGTQVATAKFEFNNGYATITIETTADGVLTPGFHDVHIHQVGKCEPNSVAPNGGAPGDFLSAGDHFQAPGHTGEPASGALPPMQVRKDGSGTMMTTTDAFAMEDLLTGQKTAIIIHAGAANSANAQSGGNNQTNGTPGPNDMTTSTGDPGKRVACGVIGAG